MITDGIFDGAVIKLGKNFQNLSILNENMIIAGCGITQKKLSEFSRENNIAGMEFLSCIPGSVGGGIRMNSGCFDREFKDILTSIQCIDFEGTVKMIDKNNVNFKYRGSDLSKDLIFLSGTFKGEKGDRNKIQDKMIELKEKKKMHNQQKLKQVAVHLKTQRIKHQKSLGANKRSSTKFINFWRCNYI